MIEIVNLQVLCNIFIQETTNEIACRKIFLKRKRIWNFSQAMETASEFLTTPSEALRHRHDYLWRRLTTRVEKIQLFSIIFKKIKCAISKICIFLVNLRKPWIVLFLSSYLYCFNWVDPKNIVVYIYLSIDFTLGVVFFVFDLQVIFDEKKLGSSYEVLLDNSWMTI